MIVCVQGASQESGREPEARARRAERENAALARGIHAFVAGLILLGAGGCGGRNSDRAQAEALLRRISALDPNAAPAERQTRIAELRALALAEPELVRTRDECAAAHAGLLAAEAEQAEARARLDAMQKAGGQVPEIALREISAHVAHASETLTRARSALGACEQRTRALALHYR